MRIDTDFFASPIFIFLALLAAGFVLYLVLRALGRRRAGDNGGRAEAPRAGQLFLWLAVAGCFLGFLLWAVKVQARVESLEQGLRQNVDSLSSQLSSSYSELISALEEKSKLFDEFSWRPVDMDLENRTVQYEFYAKPKRFSVDSDAMLCFWDLELRLTRQSDNSFSGSLVLPLDCCTWSGDASLTLRGQGQSQVQTVSLSLSPADFLCTAYCELECVPEDGKTVGLKGTVTLIHNLTSPQTVTLRLNVNGQVRQEWDLTRDLSFDLTVDDPVDLGEGMIFYLIYTDDRGLTHVQTSLAAWGGYPDVNGRVYGLEDPVYAELGTETVYDRDGGLLLSYRLY